MVDEVVGREDPLTVTAVRLKNTISGDLCDLPIDGIFVAIGHVPNTKIFRGKLKLDEEGYIIGAPSSTETSVKGIFAAGDVRDKVYRQAVTAAGMGCMGALDVASFLQKEGIV